MPKYNVETVATIAAKLCGSLEYFPEPHNVKKAVAAAIEILDTAAAACAESTRDPEV